MSMLMTSVKTKVIHKKKSITFFCHKKCLLWFFSVRSFEIQIQLRVVWTKISAIIYELKKKKFMLKFYNIGINGFFAGLKYKYKCDFFIWKNLSENTLLSTSMRKMKIFIPVNECFSCVIFQLWRIYTFLTHFMRKPGRIAGGLILSFLPRSFKLSGY